MLEYDEWVVPGEVEYARGKDAEIEEQLQRYHKMFENSSVYEESDMRVRLTEHIWGIYEIKYPRYTWEDYDITDEVLVSYFKCTGGSIDEPKIFDIPDDDIRASLPEWDDSLLPDHVQRNIMARHSLRYKATEVIKNMDGDYYHIMREFKISETKCGRIMDAFIKKLDSSNKDIEFTELEEKIADYIKEWEYDYHYREINVSCRCNYYESWYFPLTMSKEDIIDVIHEAYLNASKRSKRIIPDKFDYTNIDQWSRYRWGHVENYECLYQGKAGNILIRILFDYKNRKIAMAYPVYRYTRKKPYGYKGDDSYMDMIMGCIGIGGSLQYLKDW